MAGRYRALLIGVSTYPADAHNLQPLKGPVKDIAALSRALVHPETGLFDDADVTLLPEATSTRALRTLGGFFGSADRDDVLVVFFSGHGKLDQNGRLHLCMRDTETTDLLSTAVSSNRINEFVDASRARNVVIVLDCCYAGAFRGGDFGDAVAGPGRYVLASCRSTQLANDATVDNGTSYFTQHLVDGLLGEVADRDGDGFVGFSDLYTYIDQRMREEGKQIPHRRVDGDGDLRLARRSSDSGPTRAAAVPAARARSTESSPTRSRWTKRTIVLAAAGVAAVVAGTVVAVVLGTGDPGPSAGSGSPGHGTYLASGPWRIRIDGTAYGKGCTVQLRKTGSATPVDLPTKLYGIARYQITDAGNFHWDTTDRRCLITAMAGMGTATVPFTQTANGDTDLFAAPPAGLTVTVVDNKGSNCSLRLFDSHGQELDSVDWHPGDGDPVLDPSGATSAYVFDDNCAVRLSAHT